MAFRALAVISLFLWWTNSQAGTADDLSCGELLQTLGYEDLYHQDPRFRAALREVLLARRANKKNPIPVLNEPIGQTIILGDRTFVGLHDLVAIHKIYGNDVAATLQDVTQVENVFVVTIDKKKKYFRPLIGGENHGTKARKTLAAAKLAKGLKVKSVAPARWVKIGDELGSLSDEVMGTPLDRGFRPTVAERLAAVIPQNFSNAQAFEFFVGNMDGVKRNIMTDGKGGIFVCDHDQAFLAGLVMVKGEYAEPQHEVVLGTTLPEKYSREFIAALNALTPSKIRSQMEYFLSDEEIDGLIFRRDIILMDVKLRPDAFF